MCRDNICLVHASLIMQGLGSKSEVANDQHQNKSLNNEHKWNVHNWLGEQHTLTNENKS